MALQTLWFVIIAFLLTGFFVLEGFDYGVGILLPFLGKSDNERRMVMNSIGPFWDGNEVWLIAAGGTMFGAFPQLYATLLSGFYPEMFLILFALIVRGAAFEFRSLHEDRRWRSICDWAICISSIMPGFFWGVVIANLIHGVPINAQMDYAGTILTPFQPFALLTGLTFTVLFALHAAIFLSLRVTGDLMKRAQRVVTFLWAPTLVLFLALVTVGFYATNVFKYLLLEPKMIPLGYMVLAALLSIPLLMRRGHSGWAFAMTSIVIVLSAVTLGVGAFPTLAISSLNPAWSLTIMNASSSPYTMTVISWIALTIVPFVLLYQAWNYWVFRKRLQPHTIGHY